LGGVGGRAVEANGGHWTYAVGEPRALARMLRAAGGTRETVRPTSVTLAGQAARSYRMPPYPTGGFYGGHVVVAWDADGLEYQLSGLGYANERRLRFMAQALIGAQRAAR